MTAPKPRTGAAEHAEIDFPVGIVPALAMAFLNGGAAGDLHGIRPRAAVPYPLKTPS
jgi:hypothetical protein